MITILNGKTGMVGALLMVLGLAVLSGVASASDDGQLSAKTADIVSVNLVENSDATSIKSTLAVKSKPGPCSWPIRIVSWLISPGEFSGRIQLPSSAMEIW